MPSCGLLVEMFAKVLRIGSCLILWYDFSSLSNSGVDCCDQGYPEWIFMAYSGGNIKSVYINMRFQMKTTWIHWLHLSLFKAFGRKKQTNKELGYYDLTLTSVEWDCQIASFSVIFLAWIICLITSTFNFVHVDTAKTAGTLLKLQRLKEISPSEPIIIICTMFYRLYITYTHVFIELISLSDKWNAE